MILYHCSELSASFMDNKGPKGLKGVSINETIFAQSGFQMPIALWANLWRNCNKPDVTCAACLLAACVCNPGVWLIPAVHFPPSPSVPLVSGSVNNENPPNPLPQGPKQKPPSPLPLSSSPGCKINNINDMNTIFNHMLAKHTPPLIIANHILHV